MPVRHPGRTDDAGRGEQLVGIPHQQGRVRSFASGARALLPWAAMTKVGVCAAAGAVSAFGIPSPCDSGSVLRRGVRRPATRNRGRGGDHSDSADQDFTCGVWQAMSWPRCSSQALFHRGNREDAPCCQAAVGNGEEVAAPGLALNFSESKAGCGCPGVSQYSGAAQLRSFCGLSQE